MLNIMKNILEKTYKGSCNIYIRNIEKDPKTGITKQSKERTLFKESVPCALSFKNISKTEQGDYGVSTTEIKLFLDPEIIIPLNSEIEVTQNNRTAVYKQSGNPAVYETHQEIILIHEKNA